MIDKKELYQWCAIPAEELKNYKTKVPYRIVTNSAEMGDIMAEELIAEIELANAEGRRYRAIIPCGPTCWYEPFARKVNERNVSLKNLVVFHMDECLDWQGKPLADGDPYNFKYCMLRDFYHPVREALAVLEENRYFLNPSTAERICEEIRREPIDITYGGWGQDGHIAYNQCRRDIYSPITIDELRNSTARVQYNNYDTIIALSQRTYGSAFQFVPPMSMTLGLIECLSAKKVRLFSDTGAWKQTAFRVALFSDITTDYPITLLQEHPDGLLTLTEETAKHPISEHPEWIFKGIND